MNKYFKLIGIVVLVLVVLGFNLNAFFLVSDIKKKLAQNEERMKEYSLHAMRVGAELLEKMNPEITDLKNRLFQLESELDPQKTTAENLKKAKDTLFAKASKLEAELITQKKSLEDIRAFLLTIKVNSKGSVTGKTETK